MTDIISTARSAGVHPLAMSEEYIGGLERFAAVFQQENAGHIYRLRQEIERLTLTGIHSCHAECQRPVCRLTRERDALLEALKLADRHCPVGSEAEIFVRAAIKAVEGETK